ncbi:hypothetical protein NQ314_016401 [Rhamnusium bicolor]|uniref:DNA endonuclease RBBP8 n=1 Tax=Rhamnusium bicolor TaxID=1586634 RepID=A0AAV8WW15_9CUCU|nr:hypothetical protein NQ314_016401 [Rhamnusium bicolor]
MGEMYPEAYTEWIEIFNDDLLEVWRKERKELQKASMLLSALQRELRNIQTNVEVEIINLQQQLNYKDILKERKNSLSPHNKGKKKSPNLTDKENEYDSNLLTEAMSEDKFNFNETESPDLFRNIITQLSPTENSIIDLSSDEDKIQNNGSPTIKRRRKYVNKSKLSSSAFGVNVESKNAVNTPTNTVNTPTSTLFASKNLKSNNKFEEKFTKRKSKKSKAANMTLTQMIGQPKKRLQLTTDSKAEHDADSDETYFEDSKEGSNMGVTALLSYINKDETTRLGEESLDNRMDNDHTTYCELNMDSTEEVDEFSKGAIFNETEIATSSEKPKVIAPEPEPIVRGKARKQLQGWACEKCKNFYGKMKLSAEEMKKKMDDCSKHRYKYQPPPDTMPGM